MLFRSPSFWTWSRWGSGCDEFTGSTWNFLQHDVAPRAASNTTNNSWHRSNDRVIITISRTALPQKLQKEAAQNQNVACRTYRTERTTCTQRIEPNVSHVPRIVPSIVPIPYVSTPIPWVISTLTPTGIMCCHTRIKVYAGPSGRHRHQGAHP